MTKDYLVKGTAMNGMFRAYAVRASQAVEDAHEIHDTWSAASAALGRSLVGTILLATSGLQGDGHLTVKIQGNGPIGFIVCDGKANGDVRGYVKKPHVSLPLNEKGKIDVKGAVGTTGGLSVTKMAPTDKTPYTGEVNLVSGELGEDFTYYLAQSEQIPSAMGLSVFVNQDDSIDVAGGFLVQALPGATDEALTQLEASIKDLPLVSELLRDGKAPEDILKMIFKDQELKLHETMPVQFKCDCSRDRFARDLATLRSDEIQAMIDEDHGAEAVCQFCGKKYQFSEAELKGMLKYQALQKKQK